jgi:YtcA family
MTGRELRSTETRPRLCAAALAAPLGAASVLLASGCDPILDIDGSFFPAWMVCLAVGFVLTVMARSLFARSGIEPHLGPLLLIYPSLALLITLLTWLALYRS